MAIYCIVICLYGWIQVSMHPFTTVNEKKRLPIHSYTYTNPHENWLDLYIYFVQKSGKKRTNEIDNMDKI